jgi:hypothetical protein
MRITMNDEDDLDERIKKAEEELAWEKLKLEVMVDAYHRLLWAVERPLSLRDMEIFRP